MPLQFAFAPSAGFVTGPGVQTIALLRAVLGSQYFDKQMRYVEDAVATYAFDDDELQPDDGDLVVKPDDIPALSPGRWIKVLGAPLALAWSQGGNSFGAIGILGTNDAFDLSIRAGGIERIRIAQATGNFGIGVASPSERLDVAGNAKFAGSVSIIGSASLYYESADGIAAPVSPSSRGRLRYNNTTKRWESSVDGGAYSSLVTGTGTGMAIGNAVIGGTVNSVLFVGTGGLLAQDNANLFWNNITAQLIVGNYIGGAGGGNTDPDITSLGRALIVCRQTMGISRIIAFQTFGSGGNGAEVSARSGAQLVRLFISNGVYPAWVTNGSGLIDTNSPSGLFIGTSTSSSIFFGTNSTERFRIDTNTTASETPLRVSVGGGTVQRISVGANDSGGTGFRVLRVAN